LAPSRPEPAPGTGSAVIGLADLELAVRGGVTRLVKSHINPPLLVQRALYLDPALPDMAFVYLVNSTAGILQGDRLRVDVEVAEGAKAHLTTPSATKIFAMPNGAAHQETQMTVGNGAYLEYLPDQIIPFSGARFSQSTSITVAPDATLIYGEIISPGRVDRGETLAYDCLKSRLAINGSDGAPIYHENFSITPQARFPMGIGILGSGTAPTLGTLLAVTGAPVAAALLDRIRGCLEDLKGVDEGSRFGVTLLPGGAGVALKITAPSAGMIRNTLRVAWHEVRQETLGVGLPDLRKY
jgi:urease accessory protein